MPTPAHIQRLVATQLASAMSAKTWTTAVPSIEATFRRVPDYGLEDLGTLKVSVIPGPIALNTRDPQPRGCDLCQVTVGVVLAKTVNSEAEIGDLEDLNQAVFDQIRSELVPLAGLPNGAEWVEITLPTPFDRDALTDRNVFMSQMEITYQVPLDKLQPPPPPSP